MINFQISFGTETSRSSYIRFCNKKEPIRCSFYHWKRLVMSIVGGIVCFLMLLQYLTCYLTNQSKENNDHYQLTTAIFYKKENR